MPVEQRDAGTVKANRHASGRTTSGSAGSGYASGRHPSPMGMGGTGGMDGRHANGPRTGGERRSMEGRGRGADHQRWPNDFFTALGLFTMTAARNAAR